MAFAAVYRTTTLKTSVLLLAISASLLCGLYLLRIQDLRIATDDYGRPPPGPFSAPPPEVVTNIEEVKGIKDVGAIEYVSASKEVTVPGSVFNRTLGFEKIFVISLPERSDRRDSIILSARLMNIEIEIIDAVRGENVLDKVIPSTDVGRFMKAEIGCWRSHMNVMQEILQRNLSSVLVLEDDADWDVRLMEQLRDFGLGVQALTQPLSPLPANSIHNPLQERDDKGYEEVSFDSLPQTLPPNHSPYGDNWDMFWLGHCGMSFPEVKGTIPTARVIRTMDPTVPEKQFLTNMIGGDHLHDDYPDHTRAIHHVSTGLCSLAYAITQTGAQSLLQSVGVQQMTTLDFGLREWCDGTNGRRAHRCLTTQPALFQPNRKAGSQAADSDIDTAAHGTAIREKAMTDVVRWSTILNTDALMSGTKDFVDQYPDTKREARRSTKWRRGSLL